MSGAVRDARCQTIRVTLERAPGEIRASVSDDGAGFDTGVPNPGHLGLISMRERAESVGGRLEVRSVRGEGTTVTVTVPIRR